MVQNIVSYHAQVKEKIKVFAQQKKNLPEDVSGVVFIGKHNHEQTLNSMLSFLEFLIIQSNYQVTLGTHNIDTLWQIFVQQPNFNSDQTLFLKWINMPREAQYSANERREYYLFTDEEKNYFFTKILCNPTYVNKISYGQVKCFHKYFKVINQQEMNLDVLRKKIRVVNFENLIGLETLWKIAIESENEKSRDESMDLLVDLHLKHDIQSIPLEKQLKIWEHFISQCIKMLNSPDDSQVTYIVQLLSRFLDRYEGKKTLKPELKQAQYSNISPINIVVFFKVPQGENIKKNVHVSYFQTLGYLRVKIAEAFDLQVNEFTMHIKNSFVDPEDDDDKYIKDIGLIQTVVIQKNALYNPQNHPKFLISQNQDNYEVLFNLLNKQNPQLIETTWDLLQKLPIDQKLNQEIRELQGLSVNNENWQRILDPKSTYKLLYSLNIIQTLQPNKKDSKVQMWRDKFVERGGFSHLLHTFISLDIKSIETNLSLKCIEQLILMLWSFIQSFKDQSKIVLELKENVVLKSIALIDMITEYSIITEKNRGESYEELSKRIIINNMKKKKYKSYMAGNKGAGSSNDKKPIQQDDDDESESQESSQISQINNLFNTHNQIVMYLLRFIQITIFEHDPSAITLIAKYQNLENFLLKSTIMTENFKIREEVLKKLREFILLRRETPDFQILLKIIQILIFDVEAKADHYESRIFLFFDGVSQIIENFVLSDIEQLRPQFEQLAYQLANQILSREIKEKNTQDIDQLLTGKMKLLRALLTRFPHLKEPVGQILTDHLLHNCLFEVPQGGTTKNQLKAGAPKCKSLISRSTATKLLAVLCRDCISNLHKVLEYLQHFNQNPSWRTNKDHDWDISLMDSEKSSTGYVGIKNLGCICYMISLFQQLFMIKSFRNDLLYVKPGQQSEDKDENMFYQLQLLFAGLLKSEKQYVNPKGFCHAFKDWEGNPVNVFEQMDVEEFFNMLMDRIETAIKGSPQQNTIQYHFGGKFASETICKDCPHKYERSEPFLSISIPVKNKKSIQEGLNAFIQGDMLEGDNKYHCEKCDKKVDALKRTCVKKLPRHLIIALRRFEFDYDKMIRVKVNDYCEFPMEFSLDPYTQEGLANKEKRQKTEEGGVNEQESEIFSENLKYPKEYYEYSLSGIVVHSGTADSGHYYSFIKDREHPESGKWYELNDHVVSDFDPADIPQECFGGEDTSGYSNMMMKNMKWRNAYLLFYERKNPIDVPSDDEGDKTSSFQQQQEDIEMQNLQKDLSIFSEIEEQIKYENQKYWQNRFLFGNEYFEFVQDISLYWNTSCIIPKQFLTKNDDSEITGFSIPNEYYQETKIQELNDVKLPIDTKFIPEYEQRIFKFAAGFYITILQRSKYKNYIPDMVNLLKAYMNKNVDCAQWLLSEFSNSKILEENLLQCNLKQMRQLVVGLLYCAMLKAYPVEKHIINKYFEDINEDSNKQSTVANLALVLIYNLFEVRRFMGNSSQYMQLIARITSLGPEIREFLLKCQLVGRLMEVFFDEVSPHKDYFRDMSDIVPKFKLNPDMGIPTEIDKKQLTHFQEMLENRRMKDLANGKQRYKFLFEAVSNCIRSFRNQGTQMSPFAHEEVEFEQLRQQERDLFIPDSKFLKRVFDHSKKNRTIAYVCKGYIHFAWSEREAFNELIGVIKIGLNEFDYDEIRPYLILVQFMLQNPGGDNPEQRFEIIMQTFLEAVQQNSNFYKFMEVIFDFIFKITCRIPAVREWFQKKKGAWAWLNDWNLNTRFPANPMENTAVRVFKKRQNMQLHQQYLKNEAYKNLVIREVRLKRMEQLYNGQQPDLSKELDLDLVDLQDYKFIPGEFVEHYQRKRDDYVQPCQVEQVLDEIICVKYPVSQQDNYQQQNNIQWLSKDTDKILLINTYKSQYRSKIKEFIVQMFEKRRNESLGSGQRTMYNPNDGDERGSNQNQHYGDSDDDDNNISDDQDESLQ